MEEETDKDGKEHESRESRAKEGAFNLKSSVGGWIDAFMLTLVWLIRF